jgi:hypothetical protein
MKEKFIITKISEQPCKEKCCSLLFLIEKANDIVYLTYNEAAETIKILNHGIYQIQKVFIVE